MITFYQHQTKAINLMTLNDSFMLFMEQGTGKTLPTLFVIFQKLKNEKIKNALVVCPKAVIGSWTRDIAKFEPSEQELLLKHLTVINYESVWRKADYKQAFDLIVLDEGHAIKNRTSKQAKFLLEKSLTAKFRYILTGTPIANGHLEDIWSLICFLNPIKKARTIDSVILQNEIGGGSYYYFLDRYALIDQYFKPYKYLRVEELQHIIDKHSYRILKADCLDLPEKLPDEIYEVELAEKQMYKQMLKYSAIDGAIELLADNPIVKLTKLRQMCSGFIKTDDGTIELNDNKIKVLEDFLSGFNKKLVIFCDFTKSIDNISRLLTKKKLKHLILNGATKDKTCWKQFQSDDSIRVIIIQYQSGSQGIDLFAADTILYYEPTLRSNLLEQSRDRIHRSGQTRACSYIHLLTQGSIEIEIYKALQNYKDFTEKLFTTYLSTYQRTYRRGKQ